MHGDTFSFQVARIILPPKGLNKLRTLIVLLRRSANQIASLWNSAANGRACYTRYRELEIDKIKYLDANI